MQVLTANLGEFKDYTYTVIFARYNNRWLFCRAKTRDVYETAGGRIEPGETPLEAAKRELFEETGAVEFDITPAFDYHYTSAGQVFYAEISKLGDMPDFEMAEVGLFDGLPDNLRFPEITPVLYARLQEWLLFQLVKDEICDVYDANRQLTGRTHRRVDPMPPDDYHLVVLVCIINRNGEFLITKRAPGKHWAGMWEFQGGAATAGDDSLTAAIREGKEEAGISLKPENGELMMELLFNHRFFDIWLFIQDFDIKDVVLQPGETVDAKLATMDEIRAMIQSGEFVPDDFIEELFAKINKRLKT